MTFDGPNILVALLFSVIGLGFLRYGKKMGEFRLVVMGVALMGYSYFVPTLAWNIVVGVVLTAVPFTVWR